MPLSPGTSLKLYSSPEALRPPRPTPIARKKPKAMKSTSRALTRKPRPRVKKEVPVIALNGARDDPFVVPPPALDTTPPEVPNENDTATPPVANTALPMIEGIPEPLGEDPTARAQEQVEQQRAEEERARQQQEALAQEQEAAYRQHEIQKLEQEARQRDEAQRRAAELQTLQKQERQQEEARMQEQRLAMEREERLKAEESARQQAALALQKHAEEQQKREQEEAARRALELAARQREEQDRLDAERRVRQAAELLAKKQDEEAARERERQRQAEELLARERERALVARQKTEAEAANARQPDPELVLGDASPSGNVRSTDLPVLPRNLMGGGLAGRALEQARRPDLLQDDVPPTPQPDGGDPPRRRASLFGKTDHDVGLMMYVESWRLKIERNGNLNYPQSSVDKAHGDPVVTVAIRSDGSVEDVVIHRSSGRPELDEAVRRIVRINARYSAFPPELARRYDVIEIRRAWNFDERLRIMEEVR